MGQSSVKSGFTAAEIGSQKGKVFFVTGANTGLGLETCKVLASKGATVVMTFRNEEKSAKAVEEVGKIAAENEGSVETVLLDLADQESIKTAVEAFKEKNLPIHCLINNAGVMMCPKSLTKDGFENQFGTNHLGHFTLTALLFPILKETAASDEVSETNPVRIVNLSSSYHAMGPREGILFDNLLWDEDKTPKYNPNLAYGHSKFANVVFTKELHDRVQEAFGGRIETYVVHPGFVDTELTRHKEKEVSKVMVNAFKFVKGAFSVQKGALTQLYCATSPIPVEQKQGGEYFVPVAARSDLDEKAPKITKEMQERLWQVSEELTGVVFDVSA